MMLFRTSYIWLQKPAATDIVYLNLNISKCKVISFGRNADKTYMYKINDKDTDVPIERVDTKIWGFL